MHAKYQLREQSTHLTDLVFDAWAGLVWNRICQPVILSTNAIAPSTALSVKTQVILARLHPGPASGKELTTRVQRETQLDGAMTI